MMAIGEIGYDEIFEEDVAYEALTAFVLFLYVGLVTIVMMNLLVSLKLTELLIL